MKKKIVYPDWSKPTYLLLARGGTGNAVWREYDYDPMHPVDLLRLNVTVEIAGCGYLFGEQFATKEERDAAYLEEERREAWRNGIRIAEQLHKTYPNRDYVLQFRVANDSGWRESVCILRRFDLGKRETQA